MTQWTERALALANTLKAEGCITDPAWHAAFTATPRHVFVPRYYAMDEHNSPRVLVDGDNLDQRTAWLDATYSNQALITRYEVVGRQDDGLEIRVPTSSASQPSIVATMLDRLDLTGGETVLEVGAGTGYNAALLCQRLGERNVTSVDIDFDLIEAAQQRLAGLGHHPKLAAVDGVDGLPGAAYDRIVATCAVPGIPAAWINQLAMGGTIVAPLTFGGALAVVTNTKPGEVSGHFDAEPAWFMPMRPADQPVPNPAQGIPDQPGAAAAHRSVTSVDLEVFTNPDFRLWLALHLPDAGLIELVDETTNGQNGLLIHTATHTAAAVHEGGSLRGLPGRTAAMGHRGDRVAFVAGTRQPRTQPARPDRTCQRRTLRLARHPRLIAVVAAVPTVVEGPAVRCPIVALGPGVGQRPAVSATQSG